MKKVVSALTAATMCASMAAGAMSAFAAKFSINDVTLALRAAEGEGYTVDGNTITFATVEDAKNATFHVDEFIECGVEEPDLFQIGTHLVTSSTAVALSDETTSLDSAIAYNSEEKTYTLPSQKGGTVEVSTTAYVNCFGYANSRGKYQNGCGAIAVTSEKEIKELPDAFDHLSLIWMPDYTNPCYEDSKDTAHFSCDPSDTLPFVGFEVTLGEDIEEGTYTIDFVEEWDTKDPITGVQPATFVKDGTTKTAVFPNTKPLTIVVGDQTDETKASEDETKAPTEPATEEETKNTTDPTEPFVPDGHTWKIDDVVVDPETDDLTMVPVEVFVYGDAGSAGYQFMLTMNGEQYEGMDTTGMPVCVDISAGNKDEDSKAYPSFTAYAPNPAIGSVASANPSGTTNAVAEDGTAVFTMWFEVPADAAPGTTWDLGYYLNGQKGCMVKDINDQILDVNFVAGSIKIKGESESTEPETEPSTDEETKAPTEPSTDEETKDTTEPVDYLYGDVDKNGKVQLRDVVMLNRYLLQYDNQTLDDYQMEVANCYYDKTLNGVDSVTILKHLIGLEEAKTLPVAAE